MANGPHIPTSASTVEVSIIDSTMTMSNVQGWFDMDPVYAGFERISVPGFSFLIEHSSSHRRVLFDLGLRRDFASALHPAYVHALVEETGLRMSVDTEVPETLQAHGTTLESIEAIVFSHHHFDHVGNPSVFPPHVKLLVGPGFTDPAAKLVPGYPADPDAQGTTSDTFTGREVQEVDFERQPLKIGAFDAADYFGDGSFYILSTPGHTHSHLSALARTTAAKEGSEQPTFIFIGGDIVHHCPLFRPSVSLPLPETVHFEVNGATEPFSTAKLVSKHRLFDGRADPAAPARTQPFCRTTIHHAEPENLQRAATELSRFDAMDNVIVMFAHDASLLGVVDFFPKRVTHWKANGWKERCLWKFLRKFDI